MMNKTKRIARVALCAAMLIGGQFVLSAALGIEIVTALFLCFCVCYGAKEGMAAATVFSLLRCLLFGFSPNVLLLYLVYYNLFALFFGLISRFLWQRRPLLRLALVCLFALLFTVGFTLLDDIITPLVFGFGREAALAYFFASFYAVLPQALCALLSTALLFPPLTGVMRRLS